MKCQQIHPAVYLKWIECWLIRRHCIILPPSSLSTGQEYRQDTPESPGPLGIWYIREMRSVPARLDEGPRGVSAGPAQPVPARER